MSGQPDAKPRAFVYVDGFNLYYGCFKSQGKRAHWKNYRWLDLDTFFRTALPEYDVRFIRYFTAIVDEDPADPGQQARQAIYLRALRTIPRLAIHLGRFSTTVKHRYLAATSIPRQTRRSEPPQKVAVINQEEKGSDVNLASHLLVDGFRDRYDIAIVVSNDSDLAEPIRLVRAELNREVTLFNPYNTFAVDLRNIANHYRTVREWMLRDSQFPERFEDEHGTISRPTEWSPDPDREFNPDSLDQQR